MEINPDNQEKSGINRMWNAIKSVPRTLLWSNPDDERLSAPVATELQGTDPKSFGYERSRQQSYTNREILKYSYRDSVIRTCIEATVDEATSEDYELEGPNKASLKRCEDYLKATGFENFRRRVYKSLAVFNEYFIEFSPGVNNEIPDYKIMPTEEMWIKYNNKGLPIGYEQKSSYNKVIAQFNPKNVIHVVSSTYSNNDRGDSPIASLIELSEAKTNVIKKIKAENSKARPNAIFMYSPKMGDNSRQTVQSTIKAYKDYPYSDLHLNVDKEHLEIMQTPQTNPDAYLKLLADIRNAIISGMRCSPLNVGFIDNTYSANAQGQIRTTAKRIKSIQIDAADGFNELFSRLSERLPFFKGVTIKEFYKDPEDLALKAQLIARLGGAARIGEVREIAELPKDPDEEFNNQIYTGKEIQLTEEVK